MKRSHHLLTAVSVLLAAGTLASGSAGAAASHRGVGGLESATVTACVSGTTQSQNTATFTAAMTAVPGTRLMAVSFELYQRTAATGAFALFPAPGTGIWTDSKPGIGSFTDNEQVFNLPSPAVYRAVITYRWIGRHARLLRRDRRVTTACAITSAEPNLFITKVTHAPGTPARTTELYNVTVRNGGAAPAGAFDIGLSIGGQALSDQPVSGLAPATSTTVQFSGPRCDDGATLTAVADPSGAITEPANSARSFTMTCAAASRGSTGATGAT
jgi:hypothetical protein